MYTVKPGRACGKDEGGVRNAYGQNSCACQPSLMETSLESRMLGNQPVRFGKGELETCQRLEYGNGECRFNRSRQPFWRRGNALAIYFMKLLQCFLEFLHGDLCKAHAPRWKHNWHPVVNRCYLCVLM